MEEEKKVITQEEDHPKKTEKLKYQKSPTHNTPKKGHTKEKKKF